MPRRTSAGLFLAGVLLAVAGGIMSGLAGPAQTAGGTAAAIAFFAGITLMVAGATSPNRGRSSGKPGRMSRR